jgi:hypothetical protein
LLDGLAGQARVQFPCGRGLAELLHFDQFLIDGRRDRDERVMRDAGAL